MARHRRDMLADAGLDELFGELEPTTPRPSVRPWLVRATLQTFVVAAVAYTLSRAMGLAPSFALILAVAAGAVLIRVAIVNTREPRWQRTADVMRPIVPDTEPTPRTDGMLAAVRRWDWRLANGRTPERGFDAKLGELADERLRQRYGITRGSDPTRARELLGDPLWTLLRSTHTPTPAEFEIAVRRLESM